MTCSVYHKLYELVKCDQQEVVPPQEPLQEQKVTPLQIDMRTPFVPYERSVLEEITKYSFVEDKSVAGPSADNGIVEPPHDHSHDNNNIEKLTECKNIIDDL